MKTRNAVSFVGRKGAPSGALRQREFQVHSISWNITQRCNLKCAHCYLDASSLEEEAEGELTTEECLRTLDQIAQVNPHPFLILTGGEPLLRKDLFEIAHYAACRGFTVVLGSNGTLIDPSVVREMARHRIQGAGISLDSLDPELHDAFRGVRGAWENALRGIAALREAGFPFLIQATATQENCGQIPRLVEFSRQLGAHAFYLFFLVCTGRGQGLTDLSPHQYEETLVHLFELQRGDSRPMRVTARCAPHYRRLVYQRDPSSPLLKAYAGGCPAGTHYCRISPEGDLTPCPYLPLSAGNLKEKSFGEIWKEADVFLRLRSSGLEGRCGECEFRSICGGCRARAYAATGNYLEEDPWCRYRPAGGGAQPITLKEEDTLGLETPFELAWTEEAQGRLERVPSFARGMVIKEVEHFARETGYEEITPEVMKAVREGIWPRF